MKNRFLNLIMIIALAIITTASADAFSFRNMTLDLIHISDTHISSRDDTSYKALGSSKELLKDAVEQINKIEGLDFVLFTGDMVDSASYENYYDFYSTLSKMRYPTLNTFGNHDFQGDELSNEEVLELVKKYNPNYTFINTYYAFSPKTDYRIIVLDATIKNNNTANGQLSDEQLRFLDNELNQNQNKVVVIALHHPPVEPFVAQEHALLNAKEFNEILLKYKNPIIVLSGHYHAAKLRHFGNIVYVSTPSMVTYPMAFRHIKIVNYKDRVQYTFEFIPTRLEDVKEQNRKSVISYGTLAGWEKDRTSSFIYKKNDYKSASYKRRKINNAAKTTKTSAKEIKKLTQKPKQPKVKPEKIKQPKVKPEKVKKEKTEKVKKQKPEKIKQPKVKPEKVKKEKTKTNKKWFNFKNKKQAI